jgi:hypothetical protein
LAYELMRVSGSVISQRTNFFSPKHTHTHAHTHANTQQHSKLSPILYAGICPPDWK